MTHGFLKLQRDLLSQPQIADMYAEEGATGLGLYVALNLYLSHCEGGWGIYTSKKLTAIAVEAHRHRSDVKRIIDDYGLFITKDSRFTSLWIQRQFTKGASKMQRHCATPAHSSYMCAEEIEIEIEKENKEKGGKVSDVIGPSAYEMVDRAGLRHGHHGELVPWWASPQTDIRCVWSLCGDCWTTPDSIDPKAERQQQQEMNGQDFMMKTAWETLSEDEQSRIQDYGRRI